MALSRRTYQLIEAFNSKMKSVSKQKKNNFKKKDELADEKSGLYKSLMIYLTCWYDGVKVA